MIDTRLITLIFECLGQGLNGGLQRNTHRIYGHLTSGSKTFSFNNQKDKLLIHTEWIFKQQHNHFQTHRFGCSKRADWSMWLIHYWYWYAMHIVLYEFNNCSIQNFYLKLKKTMAFETFQLNFIHRKYYFIAYSMYERRMEFKWNAVTMNRATAWGQQWPAVASRREGTDDKRLGKWLQKWWRVRRPRQHEPLWWNELINIQNRNIYKYIKW